MTAAIEQDKMAPEQYIRPQCSAVTHMINLRLLFDYQQYLQQRLYLACSDLKSFYDRTVQSTASLALQRL